MNAQNVPVAGALNSFDDICRAAYGRAGVLLGEIAHKLILTGMCILFLVACARFFAEGALVCSCSSQCLRGGQSWDVTIPGLNHRSVACPNRSA